MENFPNATAVFFVQTLDQGDYCAVYDLKNGRIWKKFNFNDLFGDENSPKNPPYPFEEMWKNIYYFLTNHLPADIVKSLVFNLFLTGGIGNIEEHFEGFKKIKYNYGYEKIYLSSDLAVFLTSELLLTKKKREKYKLYDYIIIGRYVTMPDLCAEIYLLKRQNLGWDVLNSRSIQHKKFNSGVTKKFIDDFLLDSKINMNQIKFIIFRAHPILNDSHNFESILKSVIAPEKLIINYCPRDCKMNREEASAYYFDISGEYLAKVYSGEQYFNDYDCFVGNFVEEKFKLQCGTSTIVIPAQFKRLPFTIKKKIKFTKCKEIKLVYSNTNIWGAWCSNSTDISLNVDSEIAVVTFSMDKNKKFHCKIEKDNDQKTQLYCTYQFIEFQDDRPQFTLGKNYCSVKYYKDGLLWKLKDANGNEKIPFKLSFDKKIYIGDAALEHPQFLMSEIDLKTILNAQISDDFTVDNDQFFLDETKEYKIVLNTVDGPRKTTPAYILAIFIKSIFKLLESKIEKSVEEIYFDVSFQGISSSIAIIPVEKACEFLKISGVSLNVLTLTTNPC